MLVLLAGTAGTVVAWLVGLGFQTAETPIHYRLFGFAVLFAGLLAIMVIGRAVRRSAAPVDDVVAAARRVESGDFSARIPEHGPPELRAVARAFNAMAARLGETDARRRSFLADVSHELRTPLTVIEGHIEGVLDGVYPADEKHLAPVLEETRSLERLVDDLRTLSRADAGALTLAREPTDIEDLVADAINAARPSADVAGVTLDREIATGLPSLSIDPVRIRGVLGNLLANAIRHTPAGGRVMVTVRAGDDRRGVEVAVTDTGPGIDPGLLPHVFDRFAKGRGSRGSGLGLAIARDVVEAHGGSIAAESGPGRGTTIRFRLPSAGS